MLFFSCVFLCFLCFHLGIRIVFCVFVLVFPCWYKLVRSGSPLAHFPQSGYGALPFLIVRWFHLLMLAPISSKRTVIIETFWLGQSIKSFVTDLERKTSRFHSTAISGHQAEEEEAPQRQPRTDRWEHHRSRLQNKLHGLEVSLQVSLQGGRTRVCFSCYKSGDSFKKKCMFPSRYSDVFVFLSIRILLLIAISSNFSSDHSEGHPTTYAKKACIQVYESI